MAKAFVIHRLREGKEMKRFAVVLVCCSVLLSTMAYAGEGRFSDDNNVNSAAETEIGSVTIGTCGGAVLLWGGSTIHWPANANITALIRIRKDSLTGTVLGSGYLSLGFGLPSNLLHTITVIGIDADPATVQTYKFTAENQAGSQLFGNLFRRLVAVKAPCVLE